VPISSTKQHAPGTGAIGLQSTAAAYGTSTDSFKCRIEERAQTAEEVEDAVGRCLAWGPQSMMWLPHAARCDPALASAYHIALRSTREETRATLYAAGGVEAVRAYALSVAKKALGYTDPWYKRAWRFIKSGSSIKRFSA
jgi:hypothetical protein